MKIGVWLLKLCFQTTWCVLRAFSVFLFLIGYFFGKDYAVFEMVARFVG
ncbi:hypothetical protein HMPREF3156_01379 [Neisseria sp. HMSC06F02]|nr:hypothetical protein HMPREF3156_01379 [Neisseria sp. HMSC06F02]